ncbi:MAG: sulfatase [Acidobacteria bacterium]|nr:sulfatase [Acidobacteriota bacterium]
MLLFQSRQRKLLQTLHLGVLTFFFFGYVPAVPGGPRWNILLFTIDSCNASRMSLYGNGVETTPTLDRWAQQATVFQQAHSVSAWTAPGLVSILSGTLPGVHGVDSRDRHAEGTLPTLLKIFQQQGYEVPNLNFFTFAPYYQNLGLPSIDRSYFTENDGDELLNYLDRNAERPFFIWYHTTKVHQPYNPPEDVLKRILEMEDEVASHRSSVIGQKEIAGRQKTNWDEALGTAAIQAVRNGAIVPRGSVKFQPGDQRALWAVYDGELYNMDAFFGRVLEKLRQKGVEGRTLVVLTADHGEELLEHGFVGHASTSLSAKLFEEVTHIPLIFRLPGQVKGRRISGLVQQIDIAPTILDLLEFPVPGTMQGASLKGLLANESEVGGGEKVKGRGNAMTAVQNAEDLKDSYAAVPPGRSRSGKRMGGRTKGTAVPLRSQLFLESVIAGNQTTKERESMWVKGIRTGALKYIQEVSGGRITNEYLFNLNQDPREQKNLAPLRKRDVAHFRKQVLQTTVQNQGLRDQYSPPQFASKAADERVKECPTLEMPEPGQTLEYHLHTGAMLFQWKGDANVEYIIEYDIGLGDHQVAGQYEAKGNYQVLGPFPPELWISLKAWNPFKIRVAYAGTECWSEWRTFYF